MRSAAQRERVSYFRFWLRPKTVVTAAGRVSIKEHRGINMQRYLAVVLLLVDQRPETMRT